MKNAYFNYHVNHQIRASEVRLIGSDNKQIGVVKLATALEMADKEGLDLIEIVEKANPPVVKIMELGKFKYEEEKRLQKQKKGIRGGEIKELRFSPFIGQADYDTRMKRINEFLGESNKVRIVVKFTGRQLGSKQVGYALCKRIVDDLGETISMDMEPKFLGKSLIMGISPNKKATTGKPSKPLV